MQVRNTIGEGTRRLSTGRLSEQENADTEQIMSKEWACQDCGWYCVRMLKPKRCSGCDSENVEQSDPPIV